MLATERIARQNVRPAERQPPLYRERVAAQPARGEQPRRAPDRGVQARVAAQVEPEFGKGVVALGEGGGGGAASSLCLFPHHPRSSQPEAGLSASFGVSKAAPPRQEK